jgi:hypothetical protein
VPPILLTNQTRLSASFSFIQPPHTALQTLGRSVEFNPPDVNGVRFKTDKTLSVRIGEAINWLEGD